MQISKLFTETDDNERQHAKQFFKHMEGGMVEIPDFAEVARKEGFDKVAESFEAIMEAEKAHEARFRILHDKVVKGTVFVREEEQEWKCDNCGYMTKGTTPPDICPACIHPKSHFHIKEGNGPKGTQNLFLSRTEV